jgi:hypothetical protein
MNELERRRLLQGVAAAGADGSVESGPAPSALPAESITVSGGKIYLTAEPNL